MGALGTRLGSRRWLQEEGAGEGQEEPGLPLPAQSKAGLLGGAQERNRLKVFRDLNHHSCLFPPGFVLPPLNSDTYTVLCLFKTMLEFPTLNSANKCVLN